MRIKKIIFIILILLCFKTNISAKEIPCEYDDFDLTITYDTEKEYKKNSNPYIDSEKFTSNNQVINVLGLIKFGKCTNPTGALEIDQKLYKSVLDTWGCPSAMYACTYTFYGAENKNAILRLIDLFKTDEWNCGGDSFVVLQSEFRIMTVDEYKKNPQYEKALDGEIISGEFENCEGFWGCAWAGVKEATGFGGDWGWATSNCAYIEYDGEYVGVNVNCPRLQNRLLKYMQGVDTYTKCSKTDAACIADSIGTLNGIEDEIKSQCRFILESQDYTDGEAECIDACLSIKETLNSYREGTDLYVDYSYKGNCGFSARLIVWVNNVLKWIKYILPVLVIILGIIDFIKAIAADKDDEMKKAQGRFMRRLIAAALAFIIPLIITFILDKMGFDVYSCGVDALK